MKPVIGLLVIILTLLAPLEASAQELPRHPPLVPKKAIEPRAALLVDPGDLAYLASTASYQAGVVANLTGKKFTTLAPLVNLLDDISRLFLAAARANSSTPQVFEGAGSVEEKLATLRGYMGQLAAGDLRDLAMDTPVVIPACRSELEIDGKPIVVYRVSNPYMPLELQDCRVPRDEVRLETALDSILALLAFNSSVKIDGMYLIVTVHVPRDTAYPEVVDSILQGRLGWKVAEILSKSRLEVNETLIEELLGIVKNGSEAEALNALRTLNYYAKQGLIDEDTYLEALKIYRDRFGTIAPLTSQENRGKNQVEVNISSFLTGLEDVVKGAEKARASVQVSKKQPSREARGWHLSQPSPTIVVIAGIGLLAIALAAERDRLRPGLDVARILLGKPPSRPSPSTCYRLFVTALAMRGLKKEPWETPREYFERIRGRVSHDVAALLESLTTAYEDAVYGLEEVSVDPGACIAGARRVVIHGV
ncbi:MAG: DUF4129 domain-containing protein [Desulfurococcales archaeon]|nr:DUF4129 domain-containing protein [Desulfurococcales archaeon]